MSVMKDILVKNGRLFNCMRFFSIILFICLAIFMLITPETQATS